MLSRKNIYAILSCLPLLGVVTSSYADMVTNERELAILPEYCKGTQQIKDFAKTPKPTADHYYQVYGSIYHHLHHYCWALVSEFNANSILEKGPRNNKLHQALGDIQYVLNKNPPTTFPLLPEIYSTRARILLRLGRNGEAVGDLLKAIDLQPAYQPAYSQLSAYYLQIGQKDKAISVLEKGVEHIEDPTMLLRRLEKLGKPFKGTPGSAIPKNQEGDSPDPGQDSSTVTPQPPDSPAPIQGTTTVGGDKNNSAMPNNTQQDNKGSETVAPTNPENPYCRFCP